jgi:TolB protein
MMRRLFLLLAITLSLPAAVSAQGVAVVAVPPLAISEEAIASDREIASTALQIAQVIASDLRSTGDVLPLGPDNLNTYSLPEVSAPSFRYWRTTGAKAVVTGLVQRRPDSRLTVGCYVHDISSGRELGRVGFAVGASEWRRAAHRCSDLAFSKLTGRSAAFDSRMAYVAETGAGTARVKRIAMMDADGSNHRFVTAGEAIVLTPRLSPGGDRVAYVSFAGGRPHVRVADVSGQSDRALLPDNPVMSFAPRFSPDGRRILFTLANNGNSDLYIADSGGGGLQRLTFSPGTDTNGSFSPDGRSIVFESDRSGTSQLYVMNADGSGARRISFGGARYGAPVWSPDGEWIAFTRTGGEGLTIGVMRSSGSDEKMLTTGPRDEGPSWGTGGRQILFQRSLPGRSSLYMVNLDGSSARPVQTPVAGSDPDWSIEGAK